MSHSSPLPPDPPHRRAAHARLVAGVVGYATGAPAARILAAPRGSPKVAAARRLAMYLVNAVFAMSHSQIAAAFGRDRSTVGHSLRVIEERREDPAFDAWIESLEDMLRAAPAPNAVEDTVEDTADAS